MEVLLVHKKYTNWCGSLALLR